MKCLEGGMEGNKGAIRTRMAPLEAVVALSVEEREFCRERLGVEHALGCGRPVGHQLWQIVRQGSGTSQGAGEAVAIVVWAASALHLRDRDEWIGWDGMTRSR